MGGMKDEKIEGSWRASVSFLVVLVAHPPHLGIPQAFGGQGGGGSAAGHHLRRLAGEAGPLGQARQLPRLLPPSAAHAGPEPCIG